MMDFIFKALAVFLGWYLKKSAKDEQDRIDYIHFRKIMTRKGLSSVKMRLKARDQVKRVREKWVEEEKAAKIMADENGQSNDSV